MEVHKMIDHASGRHVRDLSSTDESRTVLKSAEPGGHHVTGVIVVGGRVRIVRASHSSVKKAERSTIYAQEKASAWQNVPKRSEWM